MGRYGKCASCYFQTKGYCSKHDRDVNKMNGCNDHKTLDEVTEEQDDF